jgi:hypothetical protein
MTLAKREIYRFIKTIADHDSKIKALEVINIDKDRQINELIKQIYCLKYLKQENFTIIFSHIILTFITLLGGIVVSSNESWFGIPEIYNKKLGLILIFLSVIFSFSLSVVLKFFIFV